MSLSVGLYSSRNLLFDDPSATLDKGKVVGGGGREWGGVEAGRVGSGRKVCEGWGGVIERQGGGLCGGEEGSGGKKRGTATTWPER